MKRMILLSVSAGAMVALLTGLLLDTHALPERFQPKIVKATLLRQVDNVHSTYWTYTLLLTGHNFTRRCKVEVDGEVRGKVHYVMASRDVMALRCVLGSWSRVFQKRKKYKVNVVNENGERSPVVEVGF